MSAKIIMETARLILREMSLDDVDVLQRMLSDSNTMAHYPALFDREMTVAAIERNRARYREHGFGLWALVLKSDATIIGDCGVTYQCVDDVDELEIGYHLRHAYWKQGYATEAAVACRDYVFETLGRDRVTSWMRPDNVASRRVAERVGMRLEKETTDGAGHPQVVYSMSRPEWERIKASPEKS